MITIKLKIHSLVDLISNSSSETYISASAQTFEYAKEIIDGLLKLSGSSLVCSDLFDVFVDDDDNSLVVRAKGTLPQDKLDLATKIGRYLSNMVNTYNIESQYNG